MRRILLLAGMLALLLTTALPALAQSGGEEQYGVDPEQEGGEPITATGVVEAYELTAHQYGTHGLTDEATGVGYALSSEVVDLDEYDGQRVTVEGTLVPGYEAGQVEGGPPLIAVSGVEALGDSEETATLNFEVVTEGQPDDSDFSGVWGVPGTGGNLLDLTDPDGDGVYTGSVERPVGETLVTEIIRGAGTVETAFGTEPGEPRSELRAQEAIVLEEDTTLSASYTFPGDSEEDPEGISVQGAITDISDSEVLVEENPGEAEVGEKGFFTVTEETGLFLQQDADQVPASFEDLAVGQSVVATYAGPVQMSYPSRGSAQSIVVLDGAAPPEGGEDPPAAGSGISAQQCIAYFGDQSGSIDQYGTGNEAELTQSQILYCNQVIQNITAGGAVDSPDGSAPANGESAGDPDRPGAPNALGTTSIAGITALPDTSGPTWVTFGAGLLLVTGALLARRTTR